MKTVGMISLGCCKNLTDSENILGVLKNPNIKLPYLIESKIHLNILQFVYN